MSLFSFYYFLIMKIVIISTSHKLPTWINQGINDFKNRIKIDIVELKPSTKSTAIERMHIEAKNIIKQVQNFIKPIIICLDEKGKNLTSVDLSNKIYQWQQQYSTLCFVIGGADGLDKDFKQQADFSLCLSSFTLPHSFVRLILAEQIYRAYSIMNNHPYHRA